MKELQTLQHCKTHENMRGKKEKKKCMSQEKGFLEENYVRLS